MINHSTVTSCTKQQTIDFLRLLIGDLDESMPELAPGGWEDSPWFTFFHPTLEQDYEAYVDITEGNNQDGTDLFGNPQPPVPILTLEEYARTEWEGPSPTQPRAELLELLGRLIYELEYCQAKHPSGCIIRFEIGRDWGTFIAQLLNMHYPLDEKDFDCYDFFNVTVLGNYIDPSPIWQLFFRRMKAAGYELLRPRYEELGEDLPLLLRNYQIVYSQLPAPAK